MISNNPRIKSQITSYLFSVFVTAAVNMVNRQKLNSFFSATQTTLSVMVEDALFQKLRAVFCFLGTNSFLFWSRFRQSIFFLSSFATFFFVKISPIFCADTLKFKLSLPITRFTIKPSSSFRFWSRLRTVNTHSFHNDLWLALFCKHKQNLGRGI